MSKHHPQSKICNCQNPSNKKIFKSHINNSFCEKCGCILIKSAQGNIYYTLKPNKKQLEIELNPIKIIQSMKKKTEEKYPYIYNIYNNANIFYDYKNDKKLNIYLKNRKMLLLKLQNLMKTFDYCDMIFFQCLFFLDTYLSQDINEEMNEKTILYYLVGYFLLSAKLKETDIYEPSFESFFNLSKGIFLSPNKIAQYEKICLKRIDYNIFSYSSYDWITQLISNGIVFNSEVDETNEVILLKGHKHTLINTVNKFAIKLLLNLTSKNSFFKYSPMYIAFSIIQISREKYIDNKMIKPKLFHKLVELYGVDHTKIQNCYEELKLEMDSENKISSKDSHKNNEENIKRHDNIKRTSVDNVQKSFNSIAKNKNLYVSNKITSSNAIISLKNDSNNDSHENNIFTNSNLKIFHDDKSRNKITLTKINHYSIDCGKSSKYNLPIINLKYAKEQKEINPIITKSKNFLDEKEKQNNAKIKSFIKPEEDLAKNDLRVKKKKLLTSNRLPKINFDEFINNKVKDVSQFEQNKEIVPIGRTKKYKLKSNKNLGLDGVL